MQELCDTQMQELCDTQIQELCDTQMQELCDTQMQWLCDTDVRIVWQMLSKQENVHVIYMYAQEQKYKFGDTDVWFVWMHVTIACHTLCDTHMLVSKRMC